MSIHWPVVSASISMAAFSIVLTGCASGIVAAVQLTTTPLKQAMTGDRQTIPAGIWNSVMSASHLWLGAATRLDSARPSFYRRPALYGVNRRQ